MVDAVRFEIARALEETGRLLRVAGESPYRARAYERAARTLEALSEDLERVVSGGRLVALPGTSSGRRRSAAGSVTCAGSGRRRSSRS